MKHYLLRCALLAFGTLSPGVGSIQVFAQTPDAPNQSSSQSSGLAGQQVTTNVLSSSHTSREMTSDLGITAKSLMGKNVETKNGDRIGSIKDLVVDTRSGRLDYVIISSGGVARIGGHEKAVPPSAVSAATSKKDTLSLDITQDRWNTAPRFDKAQLANLGDASHMKQMYQYYQKQAPALVNQPPAVPALPPTGRATGSGETSRPGGSVQLASDLVGKQIVNREGQEFGKISDLLVDVNGSKEIFAIVKPGSMIKDANQQARKQMYAIPVDSLNVNSGTRDKFMTDITFDRFQQARPFDDVSWPEAGAATGSAAVFIYQPHSDGGAAADNTARNERDRQPGAVTPTSQSESKADLQITQNIRRSVMKDDGLSMTAKNVKIITANGRVILRGPVHSAQEKQQVFQLAEQAAGAGNVENDLEVSHR
ncbi:PRC-barrel domain-containing protein [Pedosphaera parvula]|uniref:PRC-barrel domain protein n=1 Tax=Pedosphaera parvula (strain Ellin514) TaxID=320771 RepID=B9X9P3_PEDPL|nr:PRC-barrel domain-containing protein [Pedosphaera parvula]EEF63214.1 PRC-barrel domain protein [Pedosphaera parvula Ellin514]